MGDEIIVNRENSFIVLSVVFIAMFIISQLRYNLNKHKIKKKKRKWY